MAETNAFYQVTSLLLQVPVLAVALIVILVWSGVLPSQEWPWLLVTLLHLSFLPMLYGAFVYKTKRISNADITERKERLVPFFVVTLIYGIYLLVTMLFDAPDIFKMLAVYYFTPALILSMVTVFWKVSVHTAGVTQLVALLMIIFGSQALILAPLILLTGWLRIKMKSHTIWQVLGGIVVALVSIAVATKIRFP